MLYTIYIIYILGLLKKTLTMVKTKYLTLIFFLIFFLKRHPSYCCHFDKKFIEEHHLKAHI